jgi:molecular chaperone DnaK (HSP70)
MGLIEAPRNSDWTGCIDFGTAMSKAAVVRRKPRKSLTSADVAALAIGERDGVASRNRLLLPSIVYVTDQAVVFGEEAQTAAIRGERLDREAFVSPKQYLSTREAEELDEPLKSKIDPTGAYTARQLLALFLAHLLGDKLSAAKGVSHDLARSALGKAMSDARFDDPAAFPDVFELSSNGSASVLEATAVAAGSIRETGRRVVVVADIGGGTSDFGAFMTGLRGKDVLAEIRGSSRVLREAGDHLDMLLTRHILDDAGIEREDPAGRGAANRLRVDQRANKEALFADGEIIVRLGDDVRTVRQEVFLADPRVRAFAERLRSKFSETLEFAIECARQNPLGLDRRTPVEVLLTGGGHSLPMVKEFVTNPPIPWKYLTASPEIPDGPLEEGFRAVHRQLAVAIGGAVRDLPQRTAPVRVKDSPDASATEADVQPNSAGIIRQTVDILDAAQAVHEAAGVDHPPAAAYASGSTRPQAAGAQPPKSAGSRRLASRTKR